ncbi:MAG: tetratricopeptide repeat protein [Chloroflexi bacterium]|nr:tetratricopeptide repeat protein [Chloroflexota bacterium]
MEGFTTPYIRFDPTLPYAARPEDVPNPQEAEARYIAVYLDVRNTAESALRGRQPAAGMALLAREEANLRAALARAFSRGDRDAGGWMADTLREYLERTGRLRERDALVQWVRDQMPEDTLDNVACDAARRHAWSLFTQGRAVEAIRQVQALIQRLEREGLAGSEDVTFQLALSYGYLGRIYYHAGRPDLALDPLQMAIAGYEQLGEAQRGNLSAALGDLANALRDLGQLDAALDANERALSMCREMGLTREVAVNLGRRADILRDWQRYAEAEAAYEEALQAARAASDLGEQGIDLQNWGILHMQQGHLDQAVDLFKQALALSQQAANPGSEMRTCDLLASSEMLRGYLDAAAAWYARGRELAGQLGDQKQLAANAQNVGILYQTQAEGESDPAARDALLRQAAASLEESLAVWLETGNQVYAALSYIGLGNTCRLLGEFDQAEAHLLQGLQIHESLNLPDVYKSYWSLADLARDRGDAVAAAQWQAKYEAKVAELERLRRGEGTAAERGAGGGADEQVVQFVLALAQAAYQARPSGRGSGSPLDPQTAEALAQLADAPPPFDAIAAFLQTVAAGGALPPAPPGLPPELARILDALVEACA